MEKKRRKGRTKLIIWGLGSLLLVTLIAVAVFAQSSKSGATLQADKTLDICENPDLTWKYSGQVAVWNTGANNATGCQIFDKIENKVGSQAFQQQYIALNNVLCPATIPGFTGPENAFVIPYSLSVAPLSGTIRNNAQVTIDNHSGGRTNGPNPKFTYTGTIPPPACPTSCGCALTQGYWKTHPDDPAWSTANLSVFDTNSDASGVAEALAILNANGGNTPAFGPWYIVAKQYIAYLLNKANGACTPEGLQPLVDGMATFFATHTDSALCAPTTGRGGNSNPCSAPLADACILDNYNHGLYENGPTHCGGVTDDEPLLCPTP
jgi:hypothetical protein